MISSAHPCPRVTGGQALHAGGRARGQWRATCWAVVTHLRKKRAQGLEGRKCRPSASSGLECSRGSWPAWAPPGCSLPPGNHPARRRAARNGPQDDPGGSRARGSLLQIPMFWVVRKYTLTHFCRLPSHPSARAALGIAASLQPRDPRSLSFPQVQDPRPAAGAPCSAPAPARPSPGVPRKHGPLVASVRLHVVTQAGGPPCISG